MIQEGYIYILINPALPKNMLKIGRTGRLPDDRAAEISKGTGIPSDYIVAYEEYVPHSELAERLVHQRLGKFRISRKREFFSLPLKDAIKVVSEVAKDISERYSDLESEVGQKDPTLSAESNRRRSKDHLFTGGKLTLPEILGWIISSVGLVLGLILLARQLAAASYSSFNCFVTLLILIFSLAGLMALRNRSKSIDKAELLKNVPPGDLDSELRILLQHGSKIEAIKHVRLKTEMSLKEAKEYVENLQSYLS